MKQKNTTYICSIFLIFLFEGLFSQDSTLKITSINKNDLNILNKIEYKQHHSDSTSIYIEINKVSSYLKNLGYFANTIDSIKNKKKTYIAYFSLNEKVDSIYIKVVPRLNILTKNFKNENNIFSFPIDKLKSNLYNLTKKLDDEGKSFSKVHLKNIIIKNKTLFADLDIHQSKKRVINKVIVKGYEDFPKSYIINYFKIKSNTIFNQQKIKEISNETKNLKFIKEIKPPEVLFTKDSTLLYMYLKKTQNNSFDGVINFSSKEDGGVLFNGNIDLKLNNIFNTGEKFELFWNSIREERQEFKLSTETPYLFNSKFSPQVSFSIYKQDSTFLNTKFDSKLFYNIGSKTKLALTYNSESSENLKQIINNNIETFNNYFWGFQFQYRIPKNDFFFNDQFYFEINLTIGKRKTNQNSSNQFKIESSASYIWDLNLRSSIYIKNTTGYLNSDSFIDNELFRIGGANSIRGFNEQSIFTNSYTYFNFEYRYLTSEKSYFYTITDYSIIDSNNSKKLGLGLGYMFFSKKTLINIAFAIGKENNTPFKTKNSKLIINLINYF